MPRSPPPGRRSPTGSPRRRSPAPVPSPGSTSSCTTPFPRPPARRRSAYAPHSSRRCAAHSPATRSVRPGREEPPRCCGCRSRSFRARRPRSAGCGGRTTSNPITRFRWPPITAPTAPGSASTSRRTPWSTTSASWSAIPRRASPASRCRTGTSARARVSPRRPPVSTSLLLQPTLRRPAHRTSGSSAVRRRCCSPTGSTPGAGTAERWSTGSAPDSGAGCCTPA